MMLSPGRWRQENCTNGPSDLGQLVARSLDDVITRIQGQPSKLIKGRPARKGEQVLNTAMGNAVDMVFKTIVETELQNGRLKPFQSQLTVTPGGVRGPDVFRKGSPMIAWDVTTRDSSSHHVVRDNFRRGWNRYYLLIWDDPGTGFLMPNGMVQRLPRRV